MTDSEAQYRRMRLRYAGRCRLCGTSLTAGTTAVYERPGRTVRCIDCEIEPPAQPSPEPPPPLLENAPPHRGPLNDTDDGLRFRAPAAAVIAETLRVQATAPPRSGVDRFFGRSPLSADSLPWYRGAIGELEVARVLDALGPEWTAIHAIPVGTAGSDIDHLLIGPGGVYTINSKFHEGKNVWVARKTLMVNGQRTNHLRNAPFEANRVAKMLTQAAGRTVTVTPIVALVGARRITVKERPTEVAVLSSTQLAGWLRRRPVIESEADLAHLRRLASDKATWGHPPIHPPDLVSFAALRESVAVARRRQRTWGLVALLAPFALLAAGILNLLP